MTPDLRQLLASPELLVIDLIDSALATLVSALLLEHPPLASDPPPFRESDVATRARAVLRSVGQLRRALRAYRCAVDEVSIDLSEDMPF